MVRKGNDKSIHSEGDLEGKVVGVQAGSTSAIYVNKDTYLKKLFADLKDYRNVNEGFAALKNGEIDALIIDEIVARYEMNIHHDLFEIVEATVGPFTEFGIGFRKGNTELRDRVQKVFDEMVRDGTARKISEQWFQADLIKSHR